MTGSGEMERQYGWHHIGFPHSLPWCRADHCGVQATLSMNLVASAFCNSGVQLLFYYIIKLKCHALYDFVEAILYFFTPGIL
jgi:hypothetical protein